MNQRWPALVVGALIAVAVPLWVLIEATDRRQQELGLIVPPFAWPRVLVVHLLATLPLSLLTAAAVGPRLPRIIWGWVGLGVVTAGASVSVGSSLAEGLDLRHAGVLAGAVTRSVWCVVLELPWCLLGQSMATAEEPSPAPRWSALALAALAAVAAPYLYAGHLIEQRTKQVEERLQTGELIAARNLTAGLCDLGSDRPLTAALPGEAQNKPQARPPDELLAQLQMTIKEYSLAVEAPLPAGVPAARLERAQQLAMLGRLDEAARLLAPLGDRHVDLLLLRALVAQGQKRWDDSSRWYRRALELLERAPAGDAAVVSARIKAYNGLAYNAREQKAFAEAEGVYLEALDKVPAARAHFHYQLGRHYQAGGRPADALHHLETAVRLDPAYAGPARPLIQTLHTQTPGCLLRAWQP